MVLKSGGKTTCSFFVSGKNILGVDETYKFVTNNEGKSGDNVEPAPKPIGDPSNPLNRGCMGQVQANELATNGYISKEILKYFYGEDISITEA
jgi:hypothetical protein